MLPDPEWLRYIPFMALVSRNPPQNRPMATRLIERGIVAVISGGFAAWMAINITNAVQDEKLATLQNQVENSEARLTAQIVELRQQIWSLEVKK